jgi:hypothetical protein
MGHYFDWVILGDGPMPLHARFRIETLSIQWRTTPLEPFANGYEIWLRNVFVHYLRILVQDLVERFAMKTLKDNPRDLFRFALHNDMMINHV